MAENALEAVRFGVRKIDLNFGCPAPTVNKHQGGAVLLKEPEGYTHRPHAAPRPAQPYSAERQNAFGI